MGVYQCLLAAWLLSGKRATEASLVTVITVSGIIVFNLEHFKVLFRNVAIVAAALAHGLAAKESRTVENPTPRGEWSMQLNGRDVLWHGDTSGDHRAIARLP